MDSGYLVCVQLLGALCFINTFSSFMLPIICLFDVCMSLTRKHSYLDHRFMYPVGLVYSIAYGSGIHAPGMGPEVKI